MITASATTDVAADATQPKDPPATGDKFGRWTITGSFEFRVYNGKKHRFAHVRCDCGKTGLVSVSRLKGGYSKSCGCAVKEKHVAFMKWRAPLPKLFEA